MFFFPSYSLVVLCRRNVNATIKSGIENYEFAGETNTCTHNKDSPLLHSFLIYSQCEWRSWSYTNLSLLYFEYELGESLPFRRCVCTTLFYAHFISWFSIIIWNNWLNHCCSNDKTISCVCDCGARVSVAICLYFIMLCVRMCGTVRVWIANFNLNEMRYNFLWEKDKNHTLAGCIMEFIKFSDSFYYSESSAMKCSPISKVSWQRHHFIDEWEKLFHKDDVYNRFKNCHLMLNCFTKIAVICMKRILEHVFGWICALNSSVPNQFAFQSYLLL